MALDLYQEQINENLAKLTPTQDVEPGVFANFFSGTGRSAMKGFAETARAASMALAPAAVAEDAYRGTSVAKERFFKWHDEIFGRAVDYWTPKPNEVGVAGEVTGKLLSMLPVIMAGPAGPAIAVGAQTMTTAEDLARRHTDLSATQAVGVGMLQGAGLATGIWMPILGGSLATRVLVGGAGFNVVQGVATRAASGLVLGDSKAAKEFEAFDPKALTLDVLLGMAFGGIAHFVPSQRAQGAQAWERINQWAKGLKPSEIDSLLVLREAQHINEDSLPGRPATPADASIHVDRVRQAIDQLASDRQVDVENILVHRETSENISIESIAKNENGLISDTNTATSPVGFEVGQMWQSYPGREQHYRVMSVSEDGKLAQMDFGDGKPTPVHIDDVVSDGWKLAQDVQGDRSPRFEVDQAKIKAAEQQAQVLQEAAARVRQEEGLPRPPDQQVIPPRDITGLDPVAQSRAVGQHIERMLIDTGMQRQEATANAAIWEAFAKSAYERYGITPAELLTKYGVDVKRMDSADKLLGALDQRYNQIDTPEFRAWFGNSKVTTPEGKPLVVYHGSQRDVAISKFKGHAIWFVDNPEYASRWANLIGPNAEARAQGVEVLGAPKVYPVFLDIKNPYDTNAGDLTFMGEHIDAEMVPYEKAAIEYLQRLGYDGIKQEMGPSGQPPTETLWVAFKPEQIKSAIGNRGTFDPNNPNILFQPFYHGSPHSFDQFSSEKIGTGEGAQAYGHGLYFAENQGVAQGYARALADKPKDLMGSYITYTAKYGRPLGDGETSAGYLKSQGLPTEHAPLIDKIIEGATVEKDGSVTYSPDAMRAFRQLDAAIPTKGNLYQVEIPDEHVAKMLDWDKPLSEQSEQVKAALVPWLEAWRKDKGELLKSFGDAAAKRELQFSEKELTGETIYQDIGFGRGGDKGASQYLDSLGIPGIKYLDQGSRMIGGVNKLGDNWFFKGSSTPYPTKVAAEKAAEIAGNVTRNVVVFNDKIIELTHKDGTPVTPKERAEELKPEPPAAPDTLFQDQPFYSQLTRSIEGLKTTSAPAKGWKDTIKGLVSKGQVKQAEIEATGLNEWLDLQSSNADGFLRDLIADGAMLSPAQKKKIAANPGKASDKITKQQVMDYLAQNGVKVEEVELGSEKTAIKSEFEKSGYKIEFQDDEAVYYDKDGDIVEFNDLPQNLQDVVEGNFASVGPTKFSQYQLPGGENYRELLLTLPPTVNAVEQWKVIRPDGHVAATYANEGMAGAHAERIDGTVQRGDTINAQGGFKSSHFDQPNILAHIRFNERTDAEGKKVLFIEEIQSDWAQKGKKEGFANPELDRTRDALISEREAMAGRGELLQGHPNHEAARARYEEINRLLTTEYKIGPRPTVPSAPFVGKTEAWVALSLKRMIRYAAENGFDRVAWTTGEQQAARYDLSKQVDSIRSAKMADGSGFKIVATRNGEPMISRVVPAEGVADLVGKDLADKIVNEQGGDFDSFNNTRTYSGVDLKVGGEGMKAFYDKIVPNIANDVLKKMGGGRVGEVDVNSANKKETRVVRDDDGTYAVEERKPDAEYNDVKYWEPIAFGFRTKEEAEARLAEVAVPSMKQASFEITPALREKAMAGVPLFQGGARAAVHFADGQTLIQLFEKADKTSFQHETGHVFFRMFKQLSSMPDAPLRAVEDWKKMAKWLKYEGDGPLTREQEELVARGWEKFLAEGVAPNEGLKAVFKQFRDWFIDVYHSLMNIDAPINNEIRGVMRRWLDSQAKDPVDKGGLEDPRLTDPEYRAALDMMARESGWAEEGGRIIRDHMTGEVTARTKWIAHAEWYQRLQQDEKARLPGGRRGVENAVRKAVMGEAMNIQEKRAVTWMLDEHKIIMDHWNESGANVHPDGDPFEIANLQHAEGIEPTAKNTLDMALIDRARQVDPDALENIPTNSDDATFMAAVKEIVDAHKPSTEKTDTGGEEATAETNVVAPQPKPGASGSPPPPGGAGESAGGAAAPNMVAREARAIAAENPDMKVRVGTEADGTPMYKSLNDMLDEAELDAKIAMEDMNLITVAAECLMGVA